MDKVCAQAKQGDRSIVEEFRKVVHDILQSCHDDDFLLQWLKARNFDIIEAEKMIRKSFEYRKKMGADTILISYELPEVYKTFPVTKSLGFDKENSAVRLFMAGFCDCIGYVKALSKDDLEKLLIYFLEKDLQMLREKKKELGRLDEKTTFIIDFTGFDIYQFKNALVIKAAQTLLTMYQDNYPETLKVAFLINVPYYFETTYLVFKPFLNPVTASKIMILRQDEWKEVVFNVVDKKQVPSFMGGDFKDLDENPKCTKLVHSNFNIPFCYYMHQKVCADDPSLKQVTVNRRSDFKLSVEVEHVGSVLKWIFRTKYRNIKFGLSYRLKNGESEKLIPVKLVECQEIPEQSGFICRKAGTYVLHFDNRFSILKKKKLLYKVEVESPCTQVNQTV